MIFGSLRANCHAGAAIAILALLGCATPAKVSSEDVRQVFESHRSELEEMVQMLLEDVSSVGYVSVDGRSGAGHIGFTSERRALRYQQLIEATTAHRASTVTDHWVTIQFSRSDGHAQVWAILYNDPDGPQWEDRLAPRESIEFASISTIVESEKLEENWYLVLMNI